MNLNNAKFLELKLNTFTDLPCGTTLKGARSFWEPIRNKELNYFDRDFSEHTEPLRRYSRLIASVKGLDSKLIDFGYQPLFGETYLMYNGRRVGHFDEYEINFFIEEAYELGLDVQTLID
ncbi:hypothetical protein VCHA53O466_50306 [Vibrio chagasii]|nr:hypothetical protein VCHA53O466_50306 [Vibrio chagasii]